MPPLPISKTVPTTLVRPNAFNYNEQTPEVYAKLVESISRFGFIEPIIARAVGSEYEIINGEHRWRAAKELALPEVTIVDLGALPDAQAKQLTIVLNELGGQPDQLRLASLLADIATEVPVAELLQVMPYSEKEMSVFLESMSPEFLALSPEDPLAPLPGGAGAASAAGVPGEPATLDAANAIGMVDIVLTYPAVEAASVARSLAAYGATPADAVRQLLALAAGLGDDSEEASHDA